jgi:hypothetical protein
MLGGLEVDTCVLEEHIASSLTRMEHYFICYKTEKSVCLEDNMSIKKSLFLKNL